DQDVLCIPTGIWLYLPALDVWRQSSENKRICRQEQKEREFNTACKIYNATSTSAVKTLESLFTATKRYINIDYIVFYDRKEVLPGDFHSEKDPE
ncbi:19445_t:CDS:2, partial [Rhizophagus irregularis]